MEEVSVVCVQQESEMRHHHQSHAVRRLREQATPSE